MSNIQLDKQGLQALSLIEKGRNLFITGKAGTGKTTLLKEVVRQLKEKNRLVAVTAPTGVAAHNAEGVTLHSLLRLPLSPYLPGIRIPKLYSLKDEEIRVVCKLEVLIIDEVSMVRCDMMDAADDILRHYRKSDKPFGGVQIVMFGDLFQLMPVAVEEDEERLKAYYSSMYFFGSKVMEQLDYSMLELQTIYRQDKRSFVRLLNKIRWGKLDAVSQEKLDRLFHRNYKVNEDSHQIILTTHNRKSRRVNAQRLEAMNEDEWEYKAFIDGYFPTQEYPTNYNLKLKVGARVMFLRNSDSEFFNGMLGTVVGLFEDAIVVKADEDGRIIQVERMRWDFERYHLNKRTKELEIERVGSFVQYPLKLAWAITIHKSQGLTFDEVVIDAGKAFAAGQVYVALSRCRSLDKIVLMSRITPKVVMIDPTVRDYFRTVRRVEAANSVSEMLTTKTKSSKPKPYKPVGTVGRTYAALQRGLSSEEIAKRRGLTLSTIYLHLAELVKHGLVSVYDYVSKEDIALVEAVKKKLDTDRIALIKEQLSKDLSYDELKLIMAHLKFKSQ